jgi:hypothetical protein
MPTLTVEKVAPQEIQVGMLKRLRGTPIIRHDEDWGMRYSPMPPYEILDQILDAAVVKNLSLEEIVALGHAPDTVKDVLRRILVNEYKRRQAPPGLKVTTKAFGYGRRYPIARGKEPY